MEYKGIDVSTYQGDIDWSRVKDEGIEFAIIRAGYGAGNIDDKFEQNAAACNELGIPMGVYWFSYAYTEDMARSEADYCLEAVKKYRLDYPIIYDFEYDSIRYANSQNVRVTRTLASNLVDAFCAQIQNAKYYASFYSNYDLLQRLFQPYLRTRYALWYAQYSSAPEISDKIIWQYSSVGEVGGISSHVDMDTGYEDLPAIIKAAGLNGLGEDESSHGTDKMELVYTVKRGDTLSEIADKYGTTYTALAEYNKIANPNLIYPGEKIVIPEG